MFFFLCILTYALSNHNITCYSMILCIVLSFLLAVCVIKSHVVMHLFVAKLKQSISMCFKKMSAGFYYIT